MVSSEKVCVGSGLGGDFQSASCHAVIEYNDFRDNSINTHLQGGGGAMFIKWISASGYIRINKNIITGNSVTCTSSYKAYGGGIGMAFDLPTAVDATISNNTITNNELHCEASMGAGIYVVYWEPDGAITDTYPTPVISNNIIAHNYSEDRGAGIGIWTVNHSTSSNITPQPAIINNTITNNKASDGCAIFNFNSYSMLMNNILWNDLSVEGSREIFNDDIFYPDYWPTTVTNHGRVFIRYSDIQGGWDGEGNIDAYPAFVDTSSNNFSLLASSRCVGNGIDSINVQDYWYHCPDFDYYGNVRPHSKDEFVDVGAIESPFIINDIIGGENFLLNKFSLYQNYPNPFNPVTIINYQLPKTNEVELSIFNVLGQKVAVLVNEKQNAGSYQVEWDARDFASGVYYYQLVAGEYREVKKMILLR